MPNSISVAKIDKPEWVVRKEKYNRYKIANFKSFNSSDGGAKHPRSGKVVFVYDRGDTLTMLRMNYGINRGLDGKIGFNTSDQSSIFRLKVKNGHAILWRSRKLDGGISQVRNHSCHIDNFQANLFNFGIKHKYINNPNFRRVTTPPSEDSFEWLAASEPERIRTKSEKRVLKSANERLNKVLINFLKRNGVKFKFSKDAFENVRIACYPASEGFSIEENKMNATFTRHFLHGDIKYVIKKCFGHDSAKLTKLVCERIEKDKNFNILILGLMLKRLIPIDYFYKIMDVDLKAIGTISTQKYVVDRGLSIRNARQLLKRYNAARILKLMQDPQINDFNFYDSLNIWNQRRLEDGFKLIEKPKTWAEIHECLSPTRGRNRYVPVPLDQQFDLPILEAYEKINGAMVEDLKLEVPNHTKILHQYSAKMNNCIRWYGNQVKSGSCNIVGVYRNEELLYNISIMNKRVDQFKAERNTNPPQEDMDKVFNFLKEKELVEGEFPKPYVHVPLVNADVGGRVIRVNPPNIEELI